MDTGTRVCPFCGEPPGDGVFCRACGRNLAGVDRLPTREEWGGEAVPQPIAPERVAGAAATFLAAMHAAGDPGAQKLQLEGHGRFGRMLHIRGWVLRAVHRADPEEEPTAYEPGLFLSVEGEFRRVESQVRGWGQRDFPVFHDRVAAQAIDVPGEGRVLDELAAVLRDNGVAGAPEPAS